jgi:D-sedoheptulose 7-phosphate isomerase
MVSMMTNFSTYISAFQAVLAGIEVTGSDRQPLAMDEAIGSVHRLIAGFGGAGHKLMFVGNGGSAGIAGHMAIDFAKNGGVRAVTFNDASALTCLGNDLGYDQIFAKQVEMQAFSGDALISISSSGKSPNILKATEKALEMGCKVITLSGFGADNPLRRMGMVNFYVAANVYGFVETAHQIILHAILDLGMGWKTATADVQPLQPLRAL